MATPEKQMDALDSLERQNGLIEDLAGKWSSDTQDLVREDKVQVRWERGSAVKFLLQHAAVREEAKHRIVGRLEELGHAELALRLEGDGAGRRADISRLDEVARGHQAINLNSPEIDVAVERLLARLRPELELEGGLVRDIAQTLGERRERDLPSARSVRMRSVTHPDPETRWYDRIGVLKAARALYDHLRASPSGGTSPSVDGGREYQPGPKAR